MRRIFRSCRGHLRDTHHLDTYPPGIREALWHKLKSIWAVEVLILYRSFLADLSDESSNDSGLSKVAGPCPRGQSGDHASLTI